LRFAETFVHQCCSIALCTGIILVRHAIHSKQPVTRFAMGMRRQSIFLVTTDECEVDAYDVHSSMGRGFVLQSKVPHETS